MNISKIFITMMGSILIGERPESTFLASVSYLLHPFLVSLETIKYKFVKNILADLRFVVVSYLHYFTVYLALGDTVCCILVEGGVLLKKQ